MLRSVYMNDGEQITPQPSEQERHRTIQAECHLWALQGISRVPEERDCCSEELEAPGTGNFPGLCPRTFWIVLSLSH